MNKKNVLSGIIIALVFLAALIMCGSLGEQAALWPRFICVVGLVLSFGNVIQSALKLAKDKEAAAKENDLFPLTGPQIRSALIITVIMILWGIGISAVGFLVTSVVCVTAMFFLFEPDRTAKKYAVDFGIALIAVCILYFLFVKLGVHFPKAILL